MNKVPLGSTSPHWLRYNSGTLMNFQCMDSIIKMPFTSWKLNQYRTVIIGTLTLDSPLHLEWNASSSAVPFRSLTPCHGIGINVHWYGSHVLSWPMCALRKNEQLYLQKGQSMEWNFILHCHATQSPDPVSGFYPSMNGVRWEAILSWVHAQTRPVRSNAGCPKNLSSAGVNNSAPPPVYEPNALNRSPRQGLKLKIE
jgi:hypothetical protein